MIYLLKYNAIESSRIGNKKQEKRENMEKYYISYNDYFGFYVIEEVKGNGRIVFTGSIEDCNKKCMELNTR